MFIQILTRLKTYMSSSNILVSKCVRLFNGKSYLQRYTFNLLFAVICLFMSGCSQSSSVTNNVDTTDDIQIEAVDPDAMVISKLTDGILHCLATNKYQWLKHYTVSDLNGPQVARILAGDAAFDYNITEWNVNEMEISYSEDRESAMVSIPVTCIARVNPKHGPQTTIFNFQFIYSAQHQRWLLNIK